MEDRMRYSRNEYYPQGARKVNHHDDLKGFIWATLDVCGYIFGFLVTYFGYKMFVAPVIHSLMHIFGG
jgi:hypothetical protein